MTADTFSSFLGFTLQATGNNNNNWGVILNASALQLVERSVAGNASNAVTGGTLDLSGSPPPTAATQVLDMLQIVTGILTSNQVIKVPNISKAWIWDNQTSGGFQLLLQTPSGSQINIPQGTSKYVFCDGNNNLVRLDKDQVGNFEHNTVVNPGALTCGGQSLVRTDYPDLFAKIGTTYGSADSTHFTLPLLTDTGRFLRSNAGGLSVGTAQSNQNKSHTHTGSGTTSGASASHTHTQQGSFTSGGMSANDPHTHAVTGGVFGSSTTNLEYSGAGNQGGAAAAITISSTSIAHTHSVTISGQTGNNSADHTHTYSFTTSTGSADGTEARPEALAVVISIRY